MGSSKELMRRRSQVIPRGVEQVYSIFADRAENCRVWDVEGHEYLDSAGGIAVPDIGHLHLKVVTVVEVQSKELLHTRLQALVYEPYLELCEIMNQKVPDDFAKRTLLVTIDSEVVENAAKIARAATRRSGIIAFGGAYRGRTYYTLALIGKVSPCSAGVGLMPGHVYRTFYPCPLHGISEDDAIVNIHRILKNDAAPEDIAAIMIEPVQGGGGFYAATPAFMQRLRALCDERGIVLIIGEVQSDVGHTGTLFTVEQIGVAPDLTTLTKSIAGSSPLAGVTGRAGVMDAVAPGGLGGIYTGNPIACVTVLEVLKMSEQENLLQKANVPGQKLKNGLLVVTKKHPKIGDVHGLGTMTAIGPFEGGEHNKPDVKLTAEIVTRARDKGLILLFRGSYHNVLRILAPPTTEDAQTRQSPEIISQCFAEAKQQYRTMPEATLRVLSELRKSRSDKAFTSRPTIYT